MVSEAVWRQPPAPAHLWLSVCAPGGVPRPPLPSCAGPGCWCLYSRSSSAHPRHVLLPAQLLPSPVTPPQVSWWLAVTSVDRGIGGQIPAWRPLPSCPGCSLHLTWPASPLWSRSPSLWRALQLGHRLGAPPARGGCDSRDTRGSVSKARTVLTPGTSGCQLRRGHTGAGGASSHMTGVPLRRRRGH